MLQQFHAAILIIPEERGVVQEPLLSDGLCIAAKLHITKAVVCMQS